ncbi:hypothetical protein ACROYT_G034105 [Oculina patagonica]
MGIAELFFMCLLLMQGVLLAKSDIVCQDLVDEIVCIEEKAAGNCYRFPWSGKCRKTCARCDECYDAHNLVTCEDELEKGNCGDLEVAHMCSQTCQTFSCAQGAAKR